eukprot:8463076-Alexandrium_andersonii.AAC.1
MASDNFAAAFALAEDEFGLAARLLSCNKGIRVPAGKTSWMAVRDAVFPLLGNRWTEQDVLRVYNYTISTEASRLEFLQLFARF